MSWGFKKISKILLVVALVFAFVLAPIPEGFGQGNSIVYAQENIPYQIANIASGGVVAGISGIYNAMIGEDGSCSLFSVMGPLNCFGTINYIIFTILSIFLAIAGWTFDLVLQILVFDMKKTIDTLKVIDDIWVVFRDLANILFIFVLLYASIRIIIDSGAGGVGKLIGRVILVAVLINFSLFITKAVIDSSNILALQFKEAITTDSDGNKVSIGENLIGSFGLQTILAKDIGGTSYADSIKSFNQTKILQKVQILIGGNIMSVIAIFVLILASFMLLFRFMILIILMILSPLAFVANILPQTKSYSTKWWDMLIKESFYAPIFLLFLWVSLKIVNSEGFAETLFNDKNGHPNMDDILAALSTGSFDPITGKMRGAIGSVISFALVIGFLLSSVLIGKFLGNKFSGTAMGWAKNTGKFLSTPARSFYGGALEKVRKSETLQSVALSRNPIVGVAGRFAERKIHDQTKDYRDGVDSSKKQVDRILKDASSKSGSARDKLQIEIDKGKKKKGAIEDKMGEITEPYSTNISNLEIEEKEKEKEEGELVRVGARISELEDLRMRGILSPREALEKTEMEAEKARLESSLRSRTITDIRAEIHGAKTDLRTAKSHPEYKRLEDEITILNDNIKAGEKTSEDLRVGEKARGREIEDMAVQSFASSILPTGRGAADKLRESIRKSRKSSDKSESRKANEQDMKENLNEIDDLIKKLEAARDDLTAKDRTGMSSDEIRELDKDIIDNQKDIISTREKKTKLKDAIYREEQKAEKKDE